MVKYFAIIILILFVFKQANSESAKNLTPVQICETVFGPDGYDYEQILPFCCEMHEVNFRDTSLGQMLPYDTKRNYKLLTEEDSMAVVALSLTYGEDFEDFYIFLKKLDFWHIDAIRTLSRLEYVKYTLYELSHLTPDSARKQIAEAGYTNFDKFVNRNKLLLASDKDIEEYFLENKSKFQQIADYIENNGFAKSIESLNDSNKDEKVVQMLDELLIDSIVSSEEGFFTGFMIGGILDNTAGYFYQPDSSKVPKMSKGLYILIYPLGGGWYMYKTT
ncbi:MAG: hypothetical protein KIT33_08260 [Candidatus Kapabacteria bacterium]|nr:hypothetical protein [Ignavibacteriota bacterium]MCW5884947.1 hypothetical protein [Candidatus Kapabacteria bacterium]